MRRFAIIAAGLLLGAATSLSAAATTEIPENQRIASAREWADAEGTKHKPLANAQHKATVLVFVMHDCPLTNSTAPELNRLVKEFRERGVQFYRIYGEETAAQIRKHGQDYGFSIPGLSDPEMTLARLTGATRAPEAAVLSPEGELLYRGRIDDRALTLGKIRPVAKQRDLRLAIEAVLAGRWPEARFTPAVGCYLNVQDEVAEQNESSEPS